MCDICLEAIRLGTDFGTKAYPFEMDVRGIRPSTIWRVWSPFWGKFHIRGRYRTQAAAQRAADKINKRRDKS